MSSAFQRFSTKLPIFYNIPLDKGKFDIDKDFYEDKLLPIDNIPSAREVVSVPSGTPEAERIDLDA